MRTAQHRKLTSKGCGKSEQNDDGVNGGGDDDDDFNEENDYGCTFQATASKGPLKQK